MTRRTRNVSPVRMSRRSVLRGLGGVTIALPTLAAMLDGNGRFARLAHAGGSEAPVRLLTMFVPNGLGNGGDEYTMLPELLDGGVLSPHASNILLLTGLDKVAQYSDDTSGRNDAHATGHCTFATGHGTIEGGAGGPSVDQAAAAELGGQTRFRSLVTALQNYPESYFNHVSWTGPAAPVPPEDDPAALFETLFSGGVPEPGVRDYRASILDHVGSDLDRLHERLGAEDRVRIDQHLTSIRDLEQQLGGLVSCTAPDQPAPAEDGDLSNERARALLDLIVLAFSCDLTRFGSFMLANRANSRQFPWIDVVGGADSGGGYEEGHHGMSHDSSDTGRERLRKIVSDEAAQLAYVLDRLQAVGEGAGTMLDNTMVFFATEHATSETHNVYGMQAIVAGRGGGVVPVGQRIDTGGQPWANTFVTLLQWLGLDVGNFGPYGSGPLVGV
jgi:hypothetical protein